MDASVRTNNAKMCNAISPKLSALNSLLKIVEDIFSHLSNIVDSYDNIIITGSFLEKGFHFNDVDILIISEDKIDPGVLRKAIEDITGIKSHVIVLDTGPLLQGLSTDPLYQSMFSSCIAKKKFLYKTKKRVLYKLLDLHLLKSDLMLKNFDVLTDDEKYDLTRNMIAIRLFLKGEYVRKEHVEEEIKKVFHIESVRDIRFNIVQKKRIFEEIQKSVQRNVQQNYGWNTK